MNEPDALDALYTAALRREDATEAAKMERALDELREAARPISSTQNTAIWYAARGWPVFPIKTWSKVPAIRNPHELGSAERAACKGECGRLGHGCHDASTDLSVVQMELFTGADCNYNIGIATGHQMDVIDIDPVGHREMSERLEANPALLTVPLLGIAMTPRGGYHLWVPVTGRGNAAAIWPGIDYRGRGGYVVAPPSYVDDGKAKGSYRWLMPPIKAGG